MLVVMKACQAPFLQLTENSTGHKQHHWLERCLADRSLGFDARNKQLCDIGEAGVIDPTKVIRNSLIYGSAIASILLSADCAVIPDPFRVLQEQEELHL